MAGMGLGSFLSGAAQGMQAGQRFKNSVDKQQDADSSGAAIDAAAINQPIGFGGESCTRRQSLMESEAERGRQIEEDRQRNIEKHAPTTWPVAGSLSLRAWVSIRNGNVYLQCLLAQDLPLAAALPPVASLQV